MRLRSILSTIIVLFGIVTSPLRAQATDAEDVQISILTFGPGPLVYERFGHVAVRVQAPGVDLWFDWGNFDFEEPGFLWRFVRGENRYWLERKRAGPMLDAYISLFDRTVIEQHLNLSREEKARLVDAIQAQDTPESRYYNYDYYRDNCSTRVRDLLDATLDGQLRVAMSKSSDPSLRWQTRRALWVGVDNRLLATLIDFACGPRVDQPLTPWETAFLPMELSRSLDQAMVADERGNVRPLVSSRTVLNETTMPGNAEAAEPGRVWLVPTLLGLTGAAILVAAAHAAWKSFAVLAVCWEIVVAFASIFLLFVVAFTRHWVVAWNANFLQFTPLALLIAVALIVPATRKRLAVAAVAAAGLSLLGLLITASPLTAQRAAPAIGLALPMHLAVCYGLLQRGRPVRPVPDKD